MFTGKKEEINKIEFEEIFKKSTEKLPFAIPIRSGEEAHKEKFSIWNKSKTGK
jgi:hypothetical protein